MKTNLILATIFSLLCHAAMAFEPSSKSCDYYYEVEEYYQCGKKGYPINFGHRLCNKYLQAEDEVSDAVKEWFPKVRLCLQEFIQDQYGSIRDCSDLKKRSIDSHVPCYLETGFCSLSNKDVLKIIQITSIDVFKPDIMAMSMKVLKSCAAQSSALLSAQK